MGSLSAFKKDLEQIVDIIHRTFEVDAAVFDLDSRLMACTPDYLLQKGKAVHAPSIEEAIANTSVVVNKPGHMPTCKGCRFLGKCPAKIEILRSIRDNDTPVGVITFTSFTPAGHERITGRIHEFIHTLNHFAGWIAQLVRQDRHRGVEDESGIILDASLALAKDCIMVFGPDGAVRQSSASANALFSFCDLYTRSIYHILPEPVADKIMQGSFLRETKLVIDHRQVMVSARPVTKGEQFQAAVVLIHQPETRAQTPAGGRAALPRTRQKKIGPGHMLGSSPAINVLKKRVMMLSQSSSTVLISGETGTGKGLLARIIHFSGSRAAGPFVPVNCTSIPETLFESELFGYEEGAFTGAKKGGKPGRFELAQGGTLFLDEIGEMPLHMQVKLLNVLQDYAFQRVGGVTPISMDVRIIAATNQDLMTLVNEKKFRPDLYYRLNVIPMQLPALADRKQDIGVLARAFLQEANIKAARTITDIDNEVMELFLSHDWPGNIRELQNIIEYGVNMETSATLTVQSLPDLFYDTLSHAGPHLEEETGTGQDIRSTVMLTEKQTILNCLEKYGHGMEGKKKAAGELGISLRTLYRKLGRA